MTIWCARDKSHARPARFFRFYEAAFSYCDKMNKTTRGDWWPNWCHSVSVPDSEIIH